MKKISLKISALLLCIAFLLSGCNSNGKASYSDNISTNGKEASSDSTAQAPSVDSSAAESSDRSTQSSDKSAQSSDKSTQSSSSEQNTSSEYFPPVNVQGGTVVGVTSKGYTIKEVNGITYIDGVLIVNKTYSLPSRYNPGLYSACSRAFNKMKAAAANDGISIWISSGFRNYNTQKHLYDYYCQRDGSAAADSYSARPGHSEHQSGMSIDVNSASTGDYNGIYKKVGEWLAEHCWEYGFIIRYPQGKEAVTGYRYEPWHIRYVGTELSMKLKNSGQTLEEYFGITSSYSEPNPPENNSSSEDSSAESTPSDSENSDDSNSDTDTTEQIPE